MTDITFPLPDEWATPIEEPTPHLRVRLGQKQRHHAIIEQAWIVRGRTKVRREWRRLPSVPFDAPMVEE